MSSVNKQKKNQKQQQQKKQNKNKPAARKARSSARSNPVGPGGKNSRSRGALGLSGGSNRSTSRRAQVIEEDEYIGEVNGSVAFTTTQYPANPGQSGTFPWASKIAALYEKYDFEMLEFYFKREVSEYATNGQTGKVILSFDYDASDLAPTSKQQVEDTVPHVDGMPCSPMIRLPIDCATIRNGPARYVRPGTLPANTDVKTYDAGNFYITTQGCANATVIGELRVKYRCKLTVPVLEATAGGAQLGGSLIIQSAAAGETSAASTVYGAMFASATNPLISNNIGATIASTGVITLPSGRYLVNFVNLASDTAAAVSATGLYLAQDTSASYVMATVAQLGYTHTIGYQTSTYTACEAGFWPIIWDTAQSGTTLCIQTGNTYASGTCLNRGYLSIVSMGAAVGATLPEKPCSSPSIDSLMINTLENKIKRLEYLVSNSRIRVDSDFDDEDVAIKSSSSIASSITDTLSRSTIDLVGELIARKSVSNKK